MKIRGTPSASQTESSSFTNPSTTLKQFQDQAITRSEKEVYHISYALYVSLARSGAGYVMQVVQCS